MGNPIHQLKQAIRLSSWSMVKEVYEDLAGEPAPAPIKFEETPGTLTVFPDQEVLTDLTEHVESVNRLVNDDDKLDKLADTIREETQSTTQELRAANRIDTNQFRVQMGEPSRQRAEGGTYTRAVPSEPMKNGYRDDLTEATRELKQDKILLEKGVRPTQRAIENRPPPAKVTVTCRECQKPKQVFATEAPIRRFTTDDKDGASYLCDGCIGSKAKGRKG